MERQVVTHLRREMQPEAVKKCVPSVRVDYGDSGGSWLHPEVSIYGVSGCWRSFCGADAGAKHEHLTRGRTKGCPGGMAKTTREVNIPRPYTNRSLSVNTNRGTVRIFPGIGDPAHARGMGGGGTCGPSSSALPSKSRVSGTYEQVPRKPIPALTKRVPSLYAQYPETCVRRHAYPTAPQAATTI